jgi:hypothetical protein
LDGDKALFGRFGGMIARNRVQTTRISKKKALVSSK